MKKCKILPFQNHQFDKNRVFGPFFIDYPLLPADMINFLLNTVSTISFAPEKVVQTWGEPKKKVIFHQYLVVISNLPKFGVSGDEIAGHLK